MAKKILIKLIGLTLMALLSFSSYAQEKIFLVKDNKIVATYGIDEVDYLTFDDEGLSSSSDFEITIHEVDHLSATWTVTPSDPDMYYYSGVYTKESLTDRFENSVENLCSILYNDMTFLAGMVGMAPEDFMKQSVLSQGEREFADYQLGADSEYVVVAFGCNPDGTPASETYAEAPFKTMPIEMTGLTVDFKIDNATNDVSITYTPSELNVRYYVTVREVNPEYPYNPQDEINTLIWRGSISGKSPEQVIEENTIEGVVTKSYSLDPEFEYEVYAFSLTEDGIVNSEVSTTTFVSGQVSMSDMTFELSVSNITPVGCDFTIIPSNDRDAYTIGILPLSDVENATDGQIINMYLMNEMVADWYTSYGERTVNYNSFNPDTEYVAFAFGYYHHTATTPLAKTTFKTLPGSDPTTWEPSFKNFYMGEYYGNPAAYITIDVNHPDVKYLWNVVDSYGTEEQVKEALRGEFDRYEGMGINYVEMRSIWGTQEVSFSGFEEGHEYKFFAVAVNEDYEFLTPVFFSDNFTLDGLVKAPVKKSLSASTESAPVKLYIDKE